MKHLLFFSFLVIVFFSCSRSNEQLLQDLGVIQSRTSLVSYSGDTCVLTFDYAVASNAYNGDLLPEHLFYIDTLGLISGPTTSSYLHCETLSTRKIVKKLFPASVFVLTDKSVTSINSGFNLDKIIPFKEALFRNLNANSDDLEFNFGMCAQNNSWVPGIKIVYKDFQKDITKVSADSVAPVFDITKNEGTSNLPSSIDSVLSYIKLRATYTNRILIVYTDHNSGTSDSAYVRQILSKAVNSNTHILLYNTLAPDQVLYSHSRYINGTDGYHFNDLAVGLVWTTTYRSMYTLFNLWKGNPMYQSKMRLTTSGQFFARNNYGLMRLYIKLYNSLTSVTNPLYER